MHIINLDPAADDFAYPVSADIRELISLADVMEDKISVLTARCYIAWSISKIVSKTGFPTPWKGSATTTA